LDGGPTPVSVVARKEQDNGIAPNLTRSPGSNRKAAQTLVRGWEASGEVGVVKVEIPEIKDAVERFLDDAKARGLSEATIDKDCADWCGPTLARDSQ